MKKIQKPFRLCRGDTIAVISPCHGWARDEKIRWKYELGVRRLQETGLVVTAAPNALRGTAYLSENPRARAEDILRMQSVIPCRGGSGLAYIHQKMV